MFLGVFCVCAWGIEEVSEFRQEKEALKFSMEYLDGQAATAPQALLFVSPYSRL